MRTRERQTEMRGNKLEFWLEIDFAFEWRALKKYLLGRRAF